VEGRLLQLDGAVAQLGPFLAQECEQGQPDGTIERSSDGFSFTFTAVWCLHDVDPVAWIWARFWFPGACLLMFRRSLPVIRYRMMMEGPGILLLKDPQGLVVIRTRFS